MGTLTLTEPMEGHKQLTSLLLLVISLGRTVISQNCWQCLGSGSNVDSCATTGNGTQQVAIPSQAYLTSGLANICMTKVVFNVADCPTNGNCASQATLEQVSRGLPELELEYEMFKSDSQATNATGTVCTSNGALMSCTSLCEGDLCNSNIVSSSLSGYTQTLTTDCIRCSSVTGSDSFNDCLMGTNINDTMTCAATSESVGNTNVLSGMCVTVVNYNNATMAPVSVYRGCGITSSSIIYPTGDVEFSTLGQCSPAQITSMTNGNTIDTISCVKGYVQDLETSEGSYIANYNRPAPGPMNATCLQCNAVLGDMQFSACMNPNASSTDLASMGVGESVCGCGTTACMSTTMYNANGTVIGVQRGCGTAQGSPSQDVCSYTNPSDTETSNVECQSQCTAGSTPCNNYNNPYTPDSGPTPNSSGIMALSAVILMLSMLV